VRRKAIDDRYFIFWTQSCGGSDLRRIDSDWQRVNELALILGEAETHEAVKKAYEEAAQDFRQSDWIVFRYGTWDEEHVDKVKGGQGLSDFEPGQAEEMAQRVVQRVLREGTPEEQQALIKDELARYAKRLHSCKSGSRHAVEIFGIRFPGELRRLIQSPGIDGSNPEPNSFAETFTIEQGKAFLEALKEAAKKGEAAPEALAAGFEWAS
jgi:hypothetical protein